MRKRYIKYCDKHQIKDGLLRQFLFTDNYKAAIDQIEEILIKRELEIEALCELKKVLEELHIVK